MTYRPVCDNFKKCFFFGFNTAIMLQVFMYIYTCTDPSAFLIYFCFSCVLEMGKSLLLLEYMSLNSRLVKQNYTIYL